MLTAIDPAPVYYIFNRWSVEGVENIIETNTTIMGSIRVCARPPDEYYYIANWCAGPEEKHVRKLINSLAHCLVNDINVPLCSNIKPYFNDPKFSAWIESLDAPELKFELNMNIGEFYEQLKKNLNRFKK